MRGIYDILKKKNSANKEKIPIQGGDCISGRGGRMKNAVPPCAELQEKEKRKSLGGRTIQMLKQKTRAGERKKLLRTERRDRPGGGKGKKGIG